MRSYKEFVNQTSVFELVIGLNIYCKGVNKAAAGQQRQSRGARNKHSSSSNLHIVRRISWVTVNPMF